MADSEGYNPGGQNGADGYYSEDTIENAVNVIQHTDKSTVNEIKEKTSVGRNDQIEGIDRHITEPVELGVNNVGLQQGNLKEQTVDTTEQENTFSFLEDKNISPNVSMNSQNETFLNVTPSTNDGGYFLVPTSDFNSSTQITTETSATNISLPKDDEDLGNSGAGSEMSNHNCDEICNELKEAVTKTKLTLASKFQNSDVEADCVSSEE
ncbi:uncharacterized protein LOC106474120, partial [Limulus polyphemus]|uniref:Uncharacterized protein LOC106474120 n=1 Tax=Limulus polyphemus TaxID=6850 RepID=A0ABM1BWY5_LIMPO